MSDPKKRGRGRKPCGVETMKNRFQMVMDNNLARRLDNLSTRTGLSKADIFRKAFDIFEKGQRDLLSISGEEQYFDDYYEDDVDEIDDF